MRRVLCLVLTCCILMGIAPCAVINASAVAPTTESEIESRIYELNTLLSGKYFTKSGEGCRSWVSGHGCSNCNVNNILSANWFKNLFGNVKSSQLFLSGGMSCMGFVEFAGWYIFRADNSDSVRRQVQGTYSFNYQNISSYARVGDYLRLTGPGGHSVILIGYDTNGIQVLDSNYSGTYNCKVQIHNIPYSAYSSVIINRLYSVKTGIIDISTTAKTPTLNISVSSYPIGILEQGDSYPLRGTITSNYNITSVTGSIIDSSGQTVMSYTQNLNTTSFNIRGSAVDMNLKFGTLSPGAYTLKFTAKNSAGTTENWSRSFTVAGDVATKTYTITLDANGGNVSPSSLTLKVGESFSNFPKPTFAGYRFIGWALDQIDPDFQETTATTIVRDTGAFNFTNDMTLYALWAKEQTELTQCISHQKGTFLYYGKSHPHYNYYKCSICGETFTDNKTNYVTSCETCNPPLKTEWEPWSNWSTTPVTASSTRQVETRQVKVSDSYTQYRYGRYVANGHDCWCSTYLEGLGYGRASLDYSNWSTTRYSTTGKDWSCGYCRGSHTGIDHTGTDGRAWWTEYKSPSGASYYWEETRTVAATYETQYRYRDLVS